MSDLPDFAVAWKRYEDKGYKYGRDALEQVRLGYRMAQEELARADDTAVKYLFLAMDDDKVAHPEYLADEAGVLDAVKRAVFGEVTDSEHLAEAEGIAATLLEDGYFPFEGDPPLHLFRLPDGVALDARPTKENERG